MTGRSTAEQIAAVVADIRAGRVHHPAAFDEAGIVTSLQLLGRAARPQPVVDCTAVFAMELRRDSINLYDDHPDITPPWEDALLCYANTHGNVIALQVHRDDWNGRTPKPEDWVTDNPIDWPRVRWVATTSIWVGGTSKGKTLPTMGPCHMFRHAIRDDGHPEDINWVALMERIGEQSTPRRTVPTATAEETWEAPMVTVTAAMNFLNASNVDVAEPNRPRSQRRRLGRLGVTVQTIVVRPPGKNRARLTTAVRPMDATDTALSPVRGHWARYGVDGRGLLFGKYAGKFWIPGHVRGVGGEDPVAPRNYVLKPREVMR